MLASVRTRGCVPVWNRYCSVGKPNAVEPTRAIQLRPTIRYSEAGLLDVAWRNVAERIPDVAAPHPTVRWNLSCTNILSVGHQFRPVRRRQRAHLFWHIECPRLGPPSAASAPMSPGHLRCLACVRGFGLRLLSREHGIKPRFGPASPARVGIFFRWRTQYMVGPGRFQPWWLMLLRRDTVSAYQAWGTTPFL